MSVCSKNRGYLKRAIASLLIILKIALKKFINNNGKEKTINHNDTKDKA
jgi:hypothetical protein